MGDGDWTFRHRRDIYLFVAVLTPGTLLRMAGAAPRWSLVVLAVSAAGALAWRLQQHPAARGRLEVIGGSRWIWRWSAYWDTKHVEREAVRLVFSWPAVFEAAGIKGAKLQRIVHDPDEGYAVHVEAYGKLATRINLPHFASAAGIPVEWTVETPDLLRPWEIVIREVVPPVADELHDDGRPERPEVAAEWQQPAWRPEQPADLDAERLAALRVVVDQLGAEVISAAELGRRAQPPIPKPWMSERISRLAGQLGLKRVRGRGWQRLAVAVGDER